ncbi:MAG: 16S rRNA (adenine(1518)-N(6)/adenine(1519)-N(6))-dimethyltransferase RsmA [Myxococcota bacterium]
MLEWGPGLGALTRHLLEQGLRVHAVDVDECLLGLLRHRFAPFVEREMLRLHHGDARTFDVQSVIKSEEELWSAAARRRFPLSDSPLKQSDAGAEARRRSPSGQLVLCGNLPYNIASRLLVRSVELARYVRAAVYLVQKEVAQRVCASGGKAYGLLSVLVQVRFQTRLLRTVPAGAFWPVPKVDAAVVELIPRPEQEQPQLEWGEFKALARTAFAQRRKKLGNALACLRGAGEAFRRADIDPSLRAEQLTPTDFARLHHALAK